MSTTDRPNRYAGSCDTCRIDVPAGAGRCYKRHPFTSDMPWLIGCVDRDACKARAQAAAQAISDAHAAAYEAKLAADAARAVELRETGRWGEVSMGEMNALAIVRRRSCDVEIPKTIEYPIVGGLRRFSRRITKAGASVTMLTIVDGEEYKDLPEKFATEAEAIGWTLDRMRQTILWSKTKDTPEHAALVALVEELAA